MEGCADVCGEGVAMAISTHLISTGLSRLPKALVSGALQGSIMVPVAVALIQHPTYGNILFDTGYSETFYTVTKAFPEKLINNLSATQLAAAGSAADQLPGFGLAPDEIDYIVLSHFHYDHVAGISDFPKARFIFLAEAYNHFASMGYMRRLSSGFIQELIPGDFFERLLVIDETLKINSPFAIFPEVYPVFEDGSIIAIPLPGHAPGHIRLYFDVPAGAEFFVGDAC